MSIPSLVWQSRWKGVRSQMYSLIHHSLCSGADESMCNRISIKIVRKIQAKEELIDKMFCLLGFFLLHF